MSSRCLRILPIILFLIFTSTFAQDSLTRSGQNDLTVAKIMQDPLVWIGSLPAERGIFWSDDSKWLYFMWNPEKADNDSLYKVSRNGGAPQKVSLMERKAMPSPDGDYTRDREHKVYAKNGDIFLLTIASGKIRQITNTNSAESDPAFSGDEKSVIYTWNNNLFKWQMSDGSLMQLTDFGAGMKPEDPDKSPAHEEWLKRQEAELISVLSKRSQKSDAAKASREALQPDRPLEIYINDKQVSSQQLSPDSRFVTFFLTTSAHGAKDTEVPDYITESGFAEMLPARPKVGHPQQRYEFGIYDIENDTTYFADTASIPGINDLPAFLAKTDEDSAKAAPEERGTIIFGPYWSDDGQHAFVVVRAMDNKDRWIMSLDPASGALSLLDRQHDDAWIGGPGISGWVVRPGNVGWMPDNQRIWFHSESTGYSHLYTVDITSGEQKALTSGNFEVTDARISRDKKNWFLTTSEVHPGERHFYRMPLEGGKRKQITNMTGNHQVHLSPDEKMLGIRYSFSNKPWQMYVMENKAGANARQVTDDISENFTSYNWRVPEVITFPAQDGAAVHARLYRPETPETGGPAVIFVHGAGYLQNVHKWWSSYFREYMFHNLLVDNGYTVLDIDYRASAGYGRDWRTAIYRHMGGKDLSDQVDGAKFLTENYDIAKDRIGIYGGSYGGFITFMAMFTAPDVFACGAALRPVTDWAHYNHLYTSNILNEPQLDSLAYVRSSPIYHAEGLQGALLICHGMIDTNVHFQDVVRLAQRLIELGKENWEVAIYPLEGHAFKEPGSWTDEYRRIFKLFEQNLR